MAWYGHPDTTGVNTIDYYLTSDVEAPSVLAVQGRGYYSEQLVPLRGLGTSFTHNYMQYMNATGADSTECASRDGGDGSDSSCGITEMNQSHTDTQADSSLSNNPSSSPHDPSLSWFAASSFIRALHRNTTGTRASLLVTLRLPAAAHLYIIPFPLYKASNDNHHNHHHHCSLPLPRPCPNPTLILPLVTYTSNALHLH